MTIIKNKSIKNNKIIHSLTISLLLSSPLFTIDCQAAKKDRTINKDTYQCPKFLLSKQGGDGINMNLINSLIKDGKLIIDSKGNPTKNLQLGTPWYFVGVTYCSQKTPHQCNQREAILSNAAPSIANPAISKIKEESPDGNANFDGEYYHDKTKEKLCYYHYTPKGSPANMEDKKKVQIVISTNQPSLGGAIAQGVIPSYLQSKPDLLENAPSIRSVGKFAQLNAPISRGTNSRGTKKATGKLALTKPGNCPYKIARLRKNNKEILGNDVFNSFLRNNQASIKGKTWYLWNTAHCEEWSTSIPKVCKKFTLETGAKAKDVLTKFPMKKSTVLREEGMVLRGQVQIPSDQFTANDTPISACVYAYSPIVDKKKRKGDEEKIQLMITEIDPKSIVTPPPPPSLGQKVTQQTGQAASAAITCVGNAAAGAGNIAYNMVTGAVSGVCALAGYSINTQDEPSDTPEPTSTAQPKTRAKSMGSTTQDSKNSICLKPFPTELLTQDKISKFYKKEIVIHDGMTIKLITTTPDVLKDNRKFIAGRPNRTLTFLETESDGTNVICKYKNQDFNGQEVDFSFHKNTLSPKTSPRISLGHSRRNSTKSSTGSESGSQKFHTPENSSSESGRSRSRSRASSGATTSGEG